MKQYKFQGDPNNYKWDFPLVPGYTYQGDEVPYRRHTVQELMDQAVKFKDKPFLDEWEEVTPI